jgi:hypothetical protein
MDFKHLDPHRAGPEVEAAARRAFRRLVLWVELAFAVNARPTVLLVLLEEVAKPFEANAMDVGPGGHRLHQIGLAVPVLDLTNRLFRDSGEHVRWLVSKGALPERA